MLGLGIMLTLNIVEVCIYGCECLRSTIDTLCFISSLCIVCILLIIDILNNSFKKERKKDVEKYKSDVSKFYYDIPSTNDVFNRASYAALLLKKIYASFYSNNREGQLNRHSFVIHIGEHYGQGKTSFLMLLEEEIKKINDEKPVVYINFQPWLCDTESGIIQEFFNMFRKSLVKYLPKLDNTIKEYITLLLSSVGFSGNIISLNLDNVLRKSMSTLKDTHDIIRDELRNIDRPVIITVDDVDRLQSKELMMVLKIIRDTADFPNVFYIVAADNEHLKKMLYILNIDDAHTYLNKFFNLEFLLPANENEVLEVLLRLLAGKFEDLKIEKELWNKYLCQIKKIPYIRESFSNLRDVYRFVNVYFLKIDSMPDVQELNLYELFLLTLIQIQNVEYYIQLRDNTLNVLDIVKKNNDYLLVWKVELNIIKQSQDKYIDKHIKNIQKEDKIFSCEQDQLMADGQSIPTFEDTIEQSKITSNMIVPKLMNILFWKNITSIEGNQICRYNMYFKYFANTNASYMVSRMQVVSLLKSGENEYRKALKQIFNESRDEACCSEFTYALPFVEDIKRVCILQRFFIFIEFAYQFKGCNNNDKRFYSQAEYESSEESKNKLETILFALYRRSNSRINEEIAKENQKEFIEMCGTHPNINILLVCMEIIVSNIGYLIFDTSEVTQVFQKLVKRFYRDFIEKLNGHIYIGYEEIDTIIQIKQQPETANLWNNLFEQYLLNNKDACLNLFSKLIRFNSDSIEWDKKFQMAILGDYSMNEGYSLSRLAAKFSEEKDIFDSLSHLHKYNHTLSDISLQDNPFIKMAKERQKENELIANNRVFL